MLDKIDEEKNEEALKIENKEESKEDKENNEVEGNEKILAKKNNQVKNLISLVILLTGLFVGSLFVDVAQIVQGNGYSKKNLNKSDIFEADGKTWVAYNEPAVGVKVISDDQCKKCDPSEVLVWLRRILPTVSTQKISYDSDQGKHLISQFNLKTLPAFIFDKDANKTELFSQAKVLFKPQDNNYVFDTQKLGVPVGKYLQLPKISKNDATFGKSDAKVKVIVFSDFQCPYSKLFYSSLRDAMKTYKDKVYFGYKELPLTNIHPQSLNASLSAECALEQGKFWPYADKLYASQSQWEKTKGTASFKNYAKGLKLDTKKFNQCLDSKKYQSSIDADIKEADDFGISGTPAIFVNDQFKNGVVSKDDFKKTIDEQLKK